MNSHVRTGDYPGRLTKVSEEFVSGSLIHKLGSGGLENYVFCHSTGKYTTKCKVKGITLNYETSKDVNFTKLRDMILTDTATVHVHNAKNQEDTMVSYPNTK